MRTGTALCAAITIDGGGAEAPEWLHLLPAGDARTHDGRGPYRVSDAAAMMARSMSRGDRLVICENHATDLAAPNGLPAPARGWIVELQQRVDGTWGRAEWTDEGRRMVAAREYRGVSPVIEHDGHGVVTAIRRASLVNLPNLAGLQSLHAQENNMDFRKMLIGLLGLDGDPDDAAIAAALKGWKKPGVALQAALAPIARAAGVAEDADAAVVLAGVQSLAGGADDRVTALQSELAGVTTRLNAAIDEQARGKATAFVDGAIAAGRVGVKPMRDRYIAIHMRDAAEAEGLISAMPILVPGRSGTGLAPSAEGSNDNPALLAQRAGAHQKKLAEQGVTIDFAAAVRAVASEKAA